VDIPEHHQDGGHARRAGRALQRHQPADAHMFVSLPSELRDLSGLQTRSCANADRRRVCCCSTRWGATASDRSHGRAATGFLQLNGGHERTVQDQPDGSGREPPMRLAGKARPAEDRQRGRTEGAKAACEGCRYLEGVAKSLGIGTGTAPAHLKGASNEPARGGAMTSGPQLTNSLLRRA
jgi:hypothetical protein